MVQTIQASHPGRAWVRLRPAKSAPRVWARHPCNRRGPRPGERQQYALACRRQNFASVVQTRCGVVQTARTAKKNIQNKGQHGRANWVRTARKSNVTANRTPLQRALVPAIAGFSGCKHPQRYWGQAPLKSTRTKIHDFMTKRRRGEKAEQEGSARGLLTEERRPGTRRQSWEGIRKDFPKDPKHQLSPSGRTAASTQDPVRNAPPAVRR